jgi:DNA primase
LTQGVADLLTLLSPCTDLKRVGLSHGGEYAGPCPWCGGTDRFRVWPNDNHPHFWCRRCAKRGDAIAFLREHEGIGFRQACERLGSALRAPHVAHDSIYVPDHDDPPPLVWQERGRSLIEMAQRTLCGASGVRGRRYLYEGRGLSDETIREFQLGYLPGDSWQSPLDWGLVEEKKIFIPAGIVIPGVADGVLWSITVRRIGPSQPKYRHVKGSVIGLFGADTVPVGCGYRAAFMSEGYFDAMHLWQAAGDLVGSVTLGGTKTTMTTRWLWRLRDARPLFVAYDLDAAGRQAALKFRMAYSRIRVARPEGATDLADMVAGGGDLRAWVTNHLRGCSSPAPDDASTGIHNTKQRKTGASVSPNVVDTKRIREQKR